VLAITGTVVSTLRDNVSESMPIPAGPTSNELNVPTDVKLDSTTDDAILVPVNVSAATGTVMSVAPSNDTPLIVTGVLKRVVVSELPAKDAPTNSDATTR
jgi:hypothetical protein